MRKIIHCDADCFFAAIEMRDDADLRGIPVAVGGDPGRRGVISTCNYEARAFGVHSAMASAYAKRLCPQLIILPHNIQKYREASMAMNSIFLEYSDTIEPLSLDEAFIDVSSTHHCLGSATLIAKEIRRRVAQDVGITVSAGVANNKFLAKVASDWQKPDGLTVIEPNRIRFFLKQLPITCIPGVGPATAKRCREHGIHTCYDLQQLDESQLLKWFGKFGQRLYHFSRGEDNRSVKARELRKSLSVEHTFSDDIATVEQCYPELEQLAVKITKRLNRTNQTHYINKCFIKIKFSDFERTTMEVPSKEFSLAKYQGLFKQAWERYRKPVRLLGLGVRFQQQTQLEQQMSLL